MIAIVIVGYNRPESIQRLLDSLAQAEYGEDAVDLIISVDKGKRQHEIVSIAEAYQWHYGEKKIRVFGQKQGLRPHILQCGELTQQYDAVIVLEDDVTVATNYYQYVKQMLDKYCHDNRIAGISLYTHQMHPSEGRCFTAAHNGYDVFLMQVAQSWGQCWTRNMWAAFRLWYQQNGEIITSDEKIPDYIVRWNPQSWLKYYNRYIIETNTYFVYAYVSLSTNHSEKGEHCSYETNDYQVPLLEGSMDYRIPSFENAVKYDAFFERMELNSKIFPEIPGKKILDLFGGRTKYGEADILISTKKAPYRILRQVALRYRPQEINCLQPEDGKGIYIYDLHTPDRVDSSYDIYTTTRYDIRAIHWKRTLQHGLIGFKNAVLIRIRKQ